jgi:diguanylate cyclase (GGDEF)-like protein
MREFITKRVPKILREEFVKYLFVALLGGVGTVLFSSIPTIRRFIGLPVTFTVGTLLLLVFVSSAITFFIVRLRLHAAIAALELEVSTDETTRIFNEKALSKCFDETVRRCRKENIPFCVIVFDIDGFKQINEQRGYQDANHIMSLLVKQVRATIRPDDVLIRRHRGGDEFVIFALNNSLTRGERTGNRVREQIEKYDRFRGLLNPVPLSITISVGVAECNVSSETLETVLGRADHALQFAKTKRNRVELDDRYESPMPLPNRG